MYRVIKRFTDLKDNDHKYQVGDAYPRKGSETTEERIAELSGTSNKRGVPLIEEVQKDQKERKRKG